VKICIFRFLVDAEAAFSHISIFTMPRKGVSSEPSTIASSSKYISRAVSKTTSGGNKRGSTNQTNSTDDTFHERFKRPKPKHMSETLEDLVKRRAVASALDGFDQHSRMRLKHHLHVDKNAISKHKEAVESVIMSHEGDIVLELPEDRTAWGFRASVTNDQENYYPDLFAVHIAPEADKKASKVSNSLPVTP
jgi:hypothetical protein